MRALHALAQQPARSTIYGAVAQPGERRVRIAKVVGSIPIRSTNSSGAFASSQISAPETGHQLSHRYGGGQGAGNTGRNYGSDGADEKSQLQLSGIH